MAFTDADLSCANSRFGKKEATDQDHRPRSLLSAGRGGCDSWDFFHQVEGLCVGEGIGLPHLKGVLEFFFRELLGEGTKVRLRPHYFPFTEPSFEVDCSIPGKTFRGKEWLEIAGCGLVHPKVLRGVGVDPEKFTGYAFGLGVERIAMVRHGIPDLRLLYENDVRFLKQFAAHGAV
jgi:phenylalanyl-tRNA synthetase alpha chain